MPTISEIDSFGGTMINQGNRKYEFLLPLTKGTGARLHEFVKSHWDVLAACDFFTIELLVRHKPIRCTVFFVIGLSTRKVFYAPIKLQPDGTYMKQVQRFLSIVKVAFYKENGTYNRARKSLFLEITDG